MKKIFSFLTAVLFAGSMMADSYTISFKDTGTDSDSGAGLTSETPADYIASGVEYVSSVAATGKVYNARTGRGLKFGNSSNPGAVTLTLASPVTATSIVVSARAYNDSEGNIKIQDKADYAATTTVADYTYTYATPTEISAITVGTATKRGYIISVTVNYGEGGGGEEPTMAYYVAGSMTNWGPMAAYKLAANPANEGEYMGEFTFAANDEFKVGYSDGTTIESTNYFPNGMDNNYVINEAGDYVVYFRPDGQGGEGWHYGFIYAAKKEAPADPTNCAEAAEAALSVSANNELYKDGAVYTITGYVTAIATAYNDNFHNISFWMADAADGGNVLEAYRAACASEADAPVVGDKVAVTGTLTKYNTTPEFAAGCTFEIIEQAAPTTAYYLVGTNNGWNGAGYQFAANPAAEGEYMLDVTFAANDEFKVIGVLESDTTWFPAEANNCTINEEGLYTVYFRPDYQGGQDWYAGCIYNVKKDAPVVQTYDVAEAIAAGLADDTEIMVRGVVTKIEFKGKNFAKYGSANIYVADATGAEGAFEFYNCYSLDADTFRTSSPEYDATSTAWAEFDMVADENGNEVHVGDTVVAFGKYKLYNTTHELNTGCYIVSVIPGEGPEPGEEVIIDVEYADAMYIAEQAYWQFNLYKDYNAETEVTTYPDLYIGVAPKSETAIAGTYSLDNEEIYFIEIDLDENTTITAVEATDLVVTCLGEGVYRYELAFLGDDNNSYILDVELLTDAFDDEYNPIELTDEVEPAEGVANVVVENKAVKVIVRGQLIIKKNGAEYNAAGQMMK